MPVVASSPPPESRAPDGDGALTRFAWLSIAAAVATIALKLGAWWLTGSVGLLSDALESGVNLIAAVLTLLMLGLAARAPDEDHAYGYGKAENFGSGAEGAMILVAAGLIAWTAIERLRAPAPIDEAWLGLGVSVGASTINLVVARILLAAGRRHRSIALEADGHHLMTDVWTSAGVVVGVAAVALTGWQRLDPLIALAVAANIVWTGVRIVRTSALGLLDRAWPAPELAALGQVLASYAAPVQIHAVRTRQSGRRRFVSMHVVVPGDWTIARGHALVEELERAIAAVVPGAISFTHLEPLEDPASFADTALDRR
jgi:cation diffusion facilitator family transporter